MKTLQEKIKKSQEVIRKVYGKYSTEKTIVAWTGGKDSTALLYLIRKTFNNTIPFPVMFNDSTMEFEEIYAFIKRLTRQWQINLIVAPHDRDELQTFHRTKDAVKKKELSRVMKINVLKRFVKEYGVSVFIAGIRWDEHESRSKETYFSKREDHTRIHPILHFSEADIWELIKKHNVPYVNLYDKGYRSLGEKPFTKKAISGMGERSGREHDKEHLMQKLRNMGYW